jgi:hypothetical protein
MRMPHVLGGLAVLAVAAGCSKPSPLGASCSRDKDCDKGLACYRDECLQNDSVRHMRLADARREAGEPSDRSAGDAVEVESRGSYRPARIVGVIARGSYRVRFEGQDASWDEVVTEARIRGGTKSGRARGASTLPTDG